MSKTIRPTQRLHEKKLKLTQIHKIFPFIILLTYFYEISTVVYFNQYKELITKTDF